MTDTKLPQPQELMLPTLQAIVDLGGSAAYPEIDETTVKLAGITATQMSVEFDSDATAVGPKVLHRIAWARTMLKRIGALESAGHGRWAITDYGSDLTLMSPEQAKPAIDAAVAEAFKVQEPTAETLADLRQKAQEGEPASMPVRDLIGLWGAGRRRAAVIERIITALGANGLVTDPDFTIGTLDSIVTLLAASTAGLPTDKAPTSDDGPVSGIDEVTLVVGNIPSATAGVKAVTPQEDLLTAQSEMQANDYSQLAVMSGQHNLAGAVSWESIAKAILVDRQATLTDCMDTHPKVVQMSQPLLDAVPDISHAGFVFVRDSHNKISGIITVADLSDQFAVLTRPFLLVGQIERLLRAAIDRCFSSEELREALDPDDDREVDGAQSLTLGEIQRLLESPANFALVGWLAERKVLIRHLDAVREVRNEVMHFSPDPVAESDIRRLSAFAGWIERLETQVAQS